MYVKLKISLHERIRELVVVAVALESLVEICAAVQKLDATMNQELRLPKCGYCMHCVHSAPSVLSDLFLCK